MTVLNSGLFIGQTFQAAYVTTDMDQAISVMRDKVGAGDYLRTGKVSFPLDDGGKLTLDISLGWVGDMMIELIQPIADDVEIFSDILPPEGFGLKFHHLGVRIHTMEQWEQMLGETRQRSHPHLLTITGSNSRCTYIDTYKDFGHYIEYIYYADVSKSNLGRVPQNVPGHLTRY